MPNQMPFGPFGPVNMPNYNFSDNNYLYKINELEQRIKTLEDKVSELEKKLDNKGEYVYQTSMHMM